MTTDTASLLLLLNWMSPTFPIGSFAYSHGLEQVIAEGIATTPADLQNWIGDVLAHGSAWNDAVIFARCWEDDFNSLNDLALALAGSRERYQETTDLGRNFRIAAAVWSDEAAPEGIIAYPVAAGSACARFGVDREQALVAFLQGLAAALVSVAVRLVPLGQTQGLRVLRNLSPVIAATASRAAEASLDDLGSFCLGAEIAAMRHETLEPRIFRT